MTASKDWAYQKPTGKVKINGVEITISSRGREGKPEIQTEIEKCRGLNIGEAHVIQFVPGKIELHNYQPMKERLGCAFAFVRGKTSKGVEVAICTRVKSDADAAAENAVREAEVAQANADRKKRIEDRRAAEAAANQAQA